MSELRVVPLTGIPEVGEGDDLGTLLADAIERAGGLEPGDVVVVAQKVVSKSEGRVEAVPVERHHDLILREARRVRRSRDDLVDHGDGTGIRLRERGSRPLECTR